MVYSYTNSKGTKYYLHEKEAEKTNGDKETIYYFNEDIETGACHVLPSGKIVVENDVTGIPILKEPNGRVSKSEERRINWLALGGQFVVVSTAAAVMTALSWGLKNSKKKKKETDFTDI